MIEVSALTHKNTHTQREYCNRRVHARRVLITLIPGLNIVMIDQYYTPQTYLIHIGWTTSALLFSLASLQGGQIITTPCSLKDEAGRVTDLLESTNTNQMGRKLS